MLRFLVSPVEIVGEGKVEAIRIVRNELHPDDDGSLRPRPTGQTEEIPCGLVFRSIGYRGVPLPGVPFDERSCVIPNESGRVLSGGAPLAGEYAVGWIKRGPSGIIGTNKKDAQETVDLLFEDVDAGRLPEPEDPDRDSLEELLDERVPEHVTYAGWEAIDRKEKELGEPQGRPRVKLCTFDELLEAARTKQAA